MQTNLDNVIKYTLERLEEPKHDLYYLKLLRFLLMCIEADESILNLNESVGIKHVKHSSIKIL